PATPAILRRFQPICRRACSTAGSAHCCKSGSRGVPPSAVGGMFPGSRPRTGWWTRRRTPTSCNKTYVSAVSLRPIAVSASATVAPRRRIEALRLPTRLGVRLAGMECLGPRAAALGDAHTHQDFDMTDLAKALPAVLDKIDANLDASLERLFEFLKIQSISTDPAYKDQCRAAAKFVADDLAGIGFDAS